MLETDMTKEPVCPYCGYVEPNAWEINFGGIEGEVITFCGRCEMDYICSRQATVYYSTTRIAKAKGGGMTDNQSGAVSLSALEREHLATGYAIERAAGDLPDGWSIRIDLEAGSGTVYAVDPQGYERAIESGDLFSAQINEAIDAAMEKAKGEA